MSQRTYLTTPIYYVNDVPHLGTAYTTIVCDALRRYHLLQGRDTFMLTGTDEHGLKIERQAQEQGEAPKAFVDRISARFRDAWPKLSVEANHFLRTTDASHREFVQGLWAKIQARGYLKKGSYEDWYCVGCESFKTEKELLPGNICPLHQKPVEKLKEDTYFFKLSAFEKPLLDLYKKRPDFIAPETRKNEVVSFVESGLRDLSVSRTSFSWGIPVPGDTAHVMYVWFDALSNYMSALATGDLMKFWPGPGKDTKAIHLVGKDILRFHAVYWPAFLLAAGYEEDELPSQIFAHGFLTVDGQKMSKSLRNAVDPLRLAQELGPDVLRYQLLRAISFGQDGDFDHKALIERYNADLGKNLGNLLNRTLGLCSKMTESKTPAYSTPGPLETELVARIEGNLASAAKSWEDIAPHTALEHTWDISAAANQYVDRAAPWALAKAGDTARLETTLAALLEALRLLSILIWPAMPGKSAEMRAQLGLPPLAPAAGPALFPTKFAPRPAGEPLAPTGALFPVFDKDREKEVLDKLMPKPEGDPAPAPAPAPAPGPAPGPSTDAETAAAPIAYEDFAKVDLRVGVVLTAERVPKKDKLLRLTVDVGEATARNIIAGLALTFAPEALVGRKVVVVANLQPRDFGKGMVSHGMLLATGPSEALELATVAGSAVPGMRLK